MEANQVSVIVPIYNGGQNGLRCLDALAAAGPSAGEVIIVDDGSTDGSGASARARGFTVLQTDHPRSGPAHARNVGASHAMGQVLLFVDADVVIYSDAIQRVTAIMNDPRVSAVFGSYDDAPGANTFLAQYKNLMHHYVHQSSREDATSFWAGCGAIRKSVFEAMGGFSTSYRKPSIEDIELGYRMRRAGYKICLDKQLQVKHLKQWTWRTLLVTDVLYRAIPWAGLILCERSVPSDLNLQTSHRLSTLLCLLLPLALLGLFMSPLALVFLLALIIVLGTLNSDLYRFFLVKRGVLFTFAAIPLHWFYYIYSGTAFGIALVRMLWHYPRYTLSAFIPYGPKTNSTLDATRSLE